MYVTDLQNANEKWHRMDCSDERSSELRVQRVVINCMCDR